MDTLVRRMTRLFFIPAVSLACGLAALFMADLAQHLTGSPLSLPDVAVPVCLSAVLGASVALARLVSEGDDR